MFSSVVRGDTRFGVDAMLFGAVEEEVWAVMIGRELFLHVVVESG